MEHQTLQFLQLEIILIITILTDEGYAAGSSGTKIFTGSTPLTGAAPGQPQVQLRWKIVGSSLTGANKIHGVALQWK